MNEPTAFREKAAPEVLQQLAPDGVLRVALNLSNSLLITGQGADGQWQGVAPDLAAGMAESLGAKLQLVAYKTPSEVADAAGTGAWAVALIGNEPARAARILFTEAYCEIEAGYLVPPGSALQHVDEVDRAPHRIAAYKGAAYELWLASNLQHATLVHGKTFDDTFQRFRTEGLDALASLRPKLIEDQQAWPGSRMLEGRFMTVRQSMGTSLGNHTAAAWLRRFVQHILRSGLVARLIEKHRVVGLSVASVGD